MNPFTLTIHHTCAYQGLRNVSFREPGALCFLVTPVLRFAVLPAYQQILTRLIIIIVASFNDILHIYIAHLTHLYHI